MNSFANVVGCKLIFFPQKLGIDLIVDLAMTIVKWFGRSLDVKRFDSFDRERKTTLS